MMNFKKNILVWAIVILAATNIATIVTIFYHNHHGFRRGHRGEFPMEGRNHGFGKMLNKRLNLTEEQQEKFRTFRQNYHTEVRALKEEMHGKRKLFLEELGKQKTDTIKLNQISTEIGNLHVRLKNATAKYFLQMKSCCSEEQKTKLFEVFSGMSNMEGECNMPDRCQDSLK